MKHFGKSCIAAGVVFAAATIGYALKLGPLATGTLSLGLYLIAVGIVWGVVEESK